MTLKGAGSEEDMKDTCNILITSLSSQFDRKSHRYFYYEENGIIQYCDGLSVAEAGTKYLLSRVPFEEIIVLGAGSTFNPGEEMKPLVLKEWSNFKAEDTASLSEYSFFQYRISQYLDGLDLEAVDVLENIDADRKTEIMKGFQDFLTYASTLPEYRPDRVFHMLAIDDSLYQKLMEYLPDLSREEHLWIKRVIYTQLSNSMKFFPRQDNEGLKICFIPTEKNPGSRIYVPAGNVTQVIKALEDVDARNIDIYMDMQGLANTEGLIFLAVLNMLGKDIYSRIHVKEIVTSRYDPKYVASPIDNKEMQYYDINLLVSGMSAFIRYGKVDDVKDYWISRNIENKHINKLLYAMGRVDEGISLCNIPDLVNGINLLKEVFSSTPEEELHEVETNIFRILEQTIRMDYGPLLNGDEIDELDLVKWSVRKGFYQQALTILESRLPDYIVRKGIFYYADSEESKQAFMDELNQIYWNALPKDRWQYSEIGHYFFKYYGRDRMKKTPPGSDRSKEYTDFRIASITGENTLLLKAHSRMSDNQELLARVLYTLYKLGEIRNRINHAEATSPSEQINTYDIRSESENMTLLKNGIKAFVDAMDETAEYLSKLNDEYHVIEIDPQEFKDYANTHKIYKNDYRQENHRRNERPAEPVNSPAVTAENAALKTDFPENAAPPAADQPVHSDTAKKAPEKADFHAGDSRRTSDSGRFNNSDRSYSNRRPYNNYRQNNSSRSYGNNGRPHGPKDQTVNVSVGNSKPGRHLLKITINIEE